MITIDEMSLADGETAIIADNGELIAWIPAPGLGEGGQAVVKTGYRIVTSVIDVDDSLREKLRVLKGGKPT